MPDARLSGTLHCPVFGIHIIELTCGALCYRGNLSVVMEV